MDRVPSARGPGSGSQASPPLRPAPPRPAPRLSPHPLREQRSGAARGARGSPGSSLRPGGWCGRRGRGLALQLRPLRRPPTAWDPGLQAQAPGTLPKQHTSLPPESRNPLPTPRLRKHPELPGAGLEGGRGPARQAAEGERCSRGCWGRGDAGSSWSWESVPRPLSHRPRRQRTRSVPPGDGDRPSPGIQKPAFPRPPPRAQHSAAGVGPPALPRVPAPSPSRIYTPSRCPPHSDSQKTAGEPAPRPLERSFWVSPQPDPSPPSASSHRPPQHPAGHLCPSKPLTSPTRICTCLPTAHSRKPLRGFHDRVGGGTRENRPTPAAPDGAPGRGEGAASPPRPTSSIHPLGSYSTPTGRMSTAGSQTLAPLQGAKSRLARTHREIDRCLLRGGEGGGGGGWGEGRKRELDVQLARTG